MGRDKDEERERLVILSSTFYSLRKFISVRLLSLALTVMPNDKSRADLAKYLLINLKYIE